MSSYLERVTECEHGKLREHWLTKDGKPPEGFVSSIGRPEGMCPGGSRVRVEPDYEVALRAFDDWAYTDDEGRWIKRVVDAALGGTDE